MSVMSNEPSVTGKQASQGNSAGAGAALHPYVAALLEGREQTAGRLNWVETLRSRGLERANSLSVPTVRDEEWRFTDLAPLTRLRFRRAAAPVAVATEAVAAFFAPEAAARLVFVDGAFAAEFSDLRGAPPGLVARPLAAALADGGELLELHLARLADFERDLFAAINTSHLHDGALVHAARTVPAGCTVQLLFVSTRAEAATHPRCLVIAETGAECAVIEQYVSVGDEPYFTNAVTEVAAGAGARVTHVKVQQEARSAFHLAACAVALERDASYASHTVTLGARISRHNLSVCQRGEGAEAVIDGLTLIGGRQLADTHTLMDHASPNGRCRQSNKCIVGDAGHAVFNGKVVVRSGAQLTNSAQDSRNLLLSDKARVDTKPQLEIFADDVKCSHGATVGQLDPEQLFYLRSRGVAHGDARNLLTYAFGAEMIGRIPVPSVVERLAKIVLSRTAAV